VRENAEAVFQESDRPVEAGDVATLAVGPDQGGGSVVRGSIVVGMIETGRGAGETVDNPRRGVVVGGSVAIGHRLGEEPLRVAVLGNALAFRAGVPDGQPGAAMDVGDS